MSEKLKKPIRKTKSKALRKRWWRKAHRLIGISSVAFLLILAISGVMLNHIDEWFDGDQYISNKMLLDWYGVQAPIEVLKLELRGNQKEQPYWADGQLFVVNKLVATEMAEPIAAFMHDGLIFILTHTSLELLTASGEHVEHVQTPERIHTGELFGQRLIVEGKQSHLFDLANLTFSKPATALQRQTTSRLGGTISRVDSASPQAINIRQHRLLQSKVVQDIHSGRILGPFGVMLFDLFAILFVVLAISGIFLWSRGISKPQG